MIRSLIFSVSFVFLALFAVAPVRAEKPAASTNVRVEETSDPQGWSVFDRDDLVAGYVVNSNGRPVIYPVMGPAGQAMTRDFPMKEAGEFEKSDHDHHRSLWFTHGEVNDVDFWADDEGCGSIVQRSGNASVTADGSAVIRTENDWMSPEGKRVLSDIRRFAFFEDNGRRMIDVDVLLRATDGDVNFGDTKEGSFGIRVPGRMKVDSKQGGVVTNAEGEINGKAWGKKSPWVDYSGPVSTGSDVSVAGSSSIAGITIHDCPSSFGFPTRWHVRTYGLFAANPFGIHHFDGGEKRGGIVLPQGETMRLSYRVVLHNGGLDVGVAKSDAEKYAKDARPELSSDRP